MPQSYRVRRDTTANWSSRNPVLASAEPGYNTDTGEWKVGDGTTPWNSLPPTGSSRLRYVSGGGAFMGLRNFIKGRAGHTTLQVLGDSTAGLTGNWVRKVADWAAAQDTGLTVRYRDVDASGNFQAPTTVQTGSVGTHYIDFNAVASSWAYIENATNFTTNIDVAVKVQPAAWPPSADGVLVARAEASPNLGWLLYITSTGKLRFQWSVTGSTLTNLDSNAITLSTSTFNWVRVTATLSGSDVSVNFYTGSADGFTWTQVGTTQTQVGWGPIKQPSGVRTSVGAWATSGGTGSTPADANISEVWIRDGVAGPTIADTQCTDWAVGSAATLNQGWFLDVVNAGWPSHTLNDLNINAAKLQPHMGQTLTILCSGHNDGGWAGSYYANLLNTWRTGVLNRTPNSALAVTAQNPRVSPATNINDHAARMAVLAGWASRNSAGCLDVYNLFKNDSRYTGTNTSTLYNSDLLGIHPSPTGWQLWADLVTGAIAAGV